MFSRSNLKHRLTQNFTRLWIECFLIKFYVTIARWTFKGWFMEWQSGAFTDSDWIRFSALIFRKLQRSTFERDLCCIDSRRLSFKHKNKLLQIVFGCKRILFGIFRIGSAASTRCPLNYSAYLPCMTIDRRTSADARDRRLACQSFPFNVLSCTKMMNSWRKAQKHGISREISHGAKNKAGIFHYGELFGRYSRQQAAEVHKALLHSWWMPLYVGTFSSRPGLQREMQISPIDCWKKNCF